MIRPSKLDLMNARSLFSISAPPFMKPRNALVPMLPTVEASGLAAGSSR
jgi:hypothetical protein